MGKKVHSYIAGGVAIGAAALESWRFLRKVRRFLRKLEMEPPFDPAIPLLGLYPKDLKSAYYRDTATSMFIVLCPDLWVGVVSKHPTTTKETTRGTKPYATTERDSLYKQLLRHWTQTSLTVDAEYPEHKFTSCFIHFRHRDSVSLLQL